jgi:hypothetical protein
LFILKQKLFLAVVALATVAWATLLMVLAVRNGHGTAADLVPMALVSILCGGGTAVLTVLPAFFIYRALFTPPPAAQLEDGEKVLSTITANHVLDGEARGGRLLVTERGLHFVPHRFNVQLATWSVAWERVSGFSTPDSKLVGAVAAVAGVPARPMQNFLHVDLGNGKRERLVVWNRTKVAQDLERLRLASVDERRATAAQ